MEASDIIHKSGYIIRILIDNRCHCINYVFYKPDNICTFLSSYYRKIYKVHLFCHLVYVYVIHIKTNTVYVQSVIVYILNHYYYLLHHEKEIIFAYGFFQSIGKIYICRARICDTVFFCFCHMHDSTWFYSG